MVINYLYVMWAIFTPFKADTPLLIDSNTLLPLAIPSQRLKTVTWEIHEIIYTGSTIKHLQSLLCLLRKSLKTKNSATVEEFFSMLADK